MAGRRPLPTQLKRVRGNPGKRRLNPTEPRPTTGIPPCPRWLPPRARKAWHEIGRALRDMGVLTLADRTALALLCDAFAEYCEARATVERLGSTYESRVLKASTRRVDAEADEEEGDEFSPEDWSVMIRARPEVRIAADAWRRVRAMLVEFGLTPSSRSRVHAGKPEEDVDSFEQFLTGRAS